MIKSFEKGNFGEVVFFQLNSKATAIKSIKFKELENKCKHLLLFLQEVIYNKLFSALKIGPKLVKLCGADALIFKDTFEFCMEKC